MDVHLPIADVTVNALALIAIGGGVGLLSGFFGIGGAFLMTPLLTMIGIPPAVAVATGVNQVAASSVSGAFAHWRRGNVDPVMALVLTAGGFVGSLAGVAVFAWLKRMGQLDLAIGLSYVVLLGSLGGLMLVESLRALLRRRAGRATRGRLHQHHLLHGLPLKMRFRRSRLYISALLPFALGVLTGVMTAVMGVGGGFVLIPAMIYLIGMPTGVTVGTSLMQISLVASVTTMLQAIGSHAVDVVLALFLVIGGIIGAQIGTRLGAKLAGEQLRILLAVIVLAVGLQVAWQLATTPADIFSLDVLQIGAGG